MAQNCLNDKLDLKKDRIPQEQQRFDQWVCWRWEERGGKPTKPPVNAKTGFYASITNRATWSPFTKAVSTLEAGKVDGLGFVFCEHDPFAGVDLDDCRDPQTGAIEPWAQEIIQRMNSYTEIGCAEWQEHGLGMPDEVRAAAEAYWDEMDILSEFIVDCCLVDARCTVSKADLYARYQEWSEENGEEPLKKRTFGARLIERGITEERAKTARKWRGIGLLALPQKGEGDAGDAGDAISGNSYARAS